MEQERFDGREVVMVDGKKFLMVPWHDYCDMKRDSQSARRWKAVMFSKDLEFVGGTGDPELDVFAEEMRKACNESDPGEAIFFETMDELLLWVLDRRADGEDVWSVDNPYARTMGFSTPKVWASINLTNVRKFPASAEVLAKFGPVPVELLKSIEGNPTNLLCSYESRRWLANGQVPVEPESLPDITPVVDGYELESEEYKPIDVGELDIPRPPAVKQVGNTEEPN